MLRQELYPNLLKGNPGHDGSNAGAPKSRVKRQAGLSCEDAVAEVKRAIEDHKSGNCRLPYAQLLKSVEILAKVAYGEQTTVVLETDELLGIVSEVIGEFAQEKALAPELALGLYDRISARLKDR